MEITKPRVCAHAVRGYITEIVWRVCSAVPSARWIDSAQLFDYYAFSRDDVCDNDDSIVLNL